MQILVNKRTQAFVGQSWSERVGEWVGQMSVWVRECMGVWVCECMCRWDNMYGIKSTACLLYCKTTHTFIAEVKR